MRALTGLMMAAVVRQCEHLKVKATIHTVYNQNLVQFTATIRILSIINP